MAYRDEFKARTDPFTTILGKADGWDSHWGSARFWHWSFFSGSRSTTSWCACATRAESAWSDIDVQLKKRHDLVPNLVETVKGYAAHEQSLFTRVTEARTRATRSTGPAETAEAETMLRDSLKSLFAVAEAYPELKANQNFLQLQSQLKEIEDAIEAARRYYNAVVRDFNTTVEQFPSNLVAAALQFRQEGLLRARGPGRGAQTGQGRFLRWWPHERRHPQAGRFNGPGRVDTPVRRSDALVSRHPGRPAPPGKMPK